VSDRSAMMRGLAASLFLHALLALLTWNADLFRVPDSQSAEDQTVEVFLEPDTGIPPLPEADARPDAYTSVPERQEAAVPPASPDFLALRDSRAADMIEGGDENSPPRSEQTSEVEQVAVTRHDPGSTPQGVQLLDTPDPAPVDESGRPGESGETESSSRGVDREVEPGGSISAGELEAEGSSPGDEGDGGNSAPDLAELLARSAPSITDGAESAATGDPGFTYDQKALSSESGNVVQFGEFALNTVEWDFAPWLERFRQDFLPNWIPPYAYRLGVIDGKTTIRLVVDPDGTIGGLEVLDEIGHESLHQASEAALRATAPFAPLPSDFPEENLVIILSLHYPAWKLEQPSRSTGGGPPARRR